MIVAFVAAAHVGCNAVTIAFETGEGAVILMNAKTDIEAGRTSWWKLLATNTIGLAILCRTKNLTMRSSTLANSKVVAL